ncbi:hypothetical protein LA080_001540 [Diaporthe eres]|nr:hypothetical protein LA080_001540 [Diaporthe eres]
MEDDEYLTYGLCPACFCIDLDSPDLSYEPRPIADIVAGYVSSTYVCLEKYDGLRIDKQDCITAVLYGYSDNPVTAKLDITVIRDQDETLKDAIPFLAPRTSASGSENPESILERSFEWVRNQLEICTGSHIYGGTQDVPLTTRVLELSDDEATYLRVVVPDEGAAGKYTAFSYCWVRVTREIGLRYLWVDALCIFQGQDADAINDWNIEVAKMDNVYKNAFVTISATAAQNPSGFKSEPINSRAWTLQENVMSSRVLFYTSFGLLWKCKREIIWVYSGESRACKSAGRAMAGTAAPSPENVRFMINTSRYLFSVGQDENLSARSWERILELYTTRNLTNPHDKLPALAAIAQRHSTSTGCRGAVLVLGGCWWGDIVRMDRKDSLIQSGNGIQVTS